MYICSDVVWCTAGSYIDGLLYFVSQEKGKCLASLKEKSKERKSQKNRSKKSRTEKPDLNKFTIGKFDKNIAAKKTKKKNVAQQHISGTRKK